MGLGPVNIGGGGNAEELMSQHLKAENPHNLTAQDVGAVPATRKINDKPLSADIKLSASDVNAVPTARTINGKPLSNDITLSASDVNAASLNHTHTASDVGAANQSHRHTPSDINSLGGTDYGTSRVRGIKFAETEPSTVPNGEIILVFL